MAFFSTNQRQSDEMTKKKYEKIEQITENMKIFNVNQKYSIVYEIKIPYTSITNKTRRGKFL